jgi:Predicted glycosyltransferases
MINEAIPCISIITVTYNAEKFIDRYAQSICELLQKHAQFSLTIVDNASSDKTLENLRSHIQRAGIENRVVLISSEINLGFGKACNLGAKESQRWNPAFLWFLNPDTTIDPAAAEGLIRCFEENPKADIVGSALKNEKGEKRSAAFRFPKLLTVFLSNARLGVLDRLFPNQTSTAPLKEFAFPTDWVSGASFMVKTDTFNRLNGFDPFYFLYFEEVDLFLRAQRAGCQTLFCPYSTVFHESGASTGINKKNSQHEIKPRPDYWFESRRYFYIQRFGRTYFLAVDAAFLLGQMIFRIKSFVTGRHTNEPPKLIRTIFRFSGLFKDA